ncbi:MAG: type IX secretion system membrane protein PorP/SprF [Calditrichaeota bacterium]|nr:type IX secretion system membrane protein PorP/SprF [Calditrichota bacterium]
MIGVRLKKIVILGMLVLAQGTAFGQNLVVANPAEMRDFRSAFVNPAVISFQDAHAALGGKMYHLGFVDGDSNPFRQGYVSLGLPFAISNQMGLGLQAQYFDSPLYSQSNISFMISRRIQHIYAIGIRFNLFSRSFNRDNFDLVDPDDPVFRNGTTVWAGTFGAGVSLFPWPFLSLGIGLDHINRANISLANEDVNQPFTAYFGAALTVGTLQASLSTYYEDQRWTPRLSLSTRVMNSGYALLGVSENGLMAEGQFRISGPLSLNYNYEYTIFDSEGIGQGSHALTLIHEFDRQRNLPKFEVPEEFKVQFVPPDQSMREDTQFYVYSIVNKMEIIEKKLTRKIDPSITREQLAQLSLYELGMLDSMRAEYVTPYDETPIDLGLIPATLDANLTKEYEDFVRDVSRNINENEVPTRVIASKETYLRAAGLRKYFDVDSVNSDKLAFVEPVYRSRRDSLRANEKLGNRPIKLHETLFSLSPSSTTFQITPISDIDIPKTWQLVIKDNNDREVRSFTGAGMPLAELRWHWHDASDRLIKSGVYSYHLEWRDRNDKVHKTHKKYITVQRLLRNITIEVTGKRKDTGDADEINIILKN